MRDVPRNPHEYPAIRQFAPPGHFRRARGVPPEPPVADEIFTLRENV